MLPLRLTIDTAAIAANWRWHAARSAACGAAVKADAYGLGAREVVAALAKAGCTEFFVASWQEAAELTLPHGARLAVLHGLLPGEVPLPGVIPVLNSAGQVARWRVNGGGRCDVMIDTGMSRLGLGVDEAQSGLLDGLDIDVLHSHLACADEPANPMNARQLQHFRTVIGKVPHRRAALANSAGVTLGRDFTFDLTRPGIGLYGGVMTQAAAGIVPVASLAARVVQLRDVAPGETFGYGATWTATRASRIAICNLGYADGYRRAFSDVGRADVDETACPVIGRVSMDLTGVDVTGQAVAEGDWLRFDFDLPAASLATGISQYELLTGLGRRYQRTHI